MEPNGDVSSDLSSCPHVLEIDQDRLLQTQEHFEGSPTATSLECALCLGKATSNLWLCLHADCLQVFCAESPNSNHSYFHYKQDPKHAVFLNVTDSRVCCHECELEIFITNDDDDDDDDSSRVGGSGDGLKTVRPRGLTGLQNLGNTCYMNSALQALANTPPLVSYILSRPCPEIERPAQSGSGSRSASPRMLVASFHSLITEMWSNKRHLYIAPPHILYAIRATHPMFRGFQQHDSQEFLRCLMDQLHEETKVPCPEPVYLKEPGNIQDSEPEGSEGEEYETCDSGVSERSSLSEDAANKPVSSEDSASRSSSPAPPSTTPNKSKKLHYRSIISDIFDGTLLSSVQCLTCNRVSTRVETFQDLSLPIPNRDHLNILHQGSVSGPPKCSHLYTREQGWYNWLWDWLCSWFWGPTVSLHDCLSAFFSADELKGDNMYSCEKCNKLRNGVKFSKFLKTPEVLCIHLKRFRHDLVFSSKISSYVKFPMEGLDIQPYIHEDWKGGVTKYNLISVICHHGASGSGGHYTCYALNCDSNQWFHYDDSNVTKVSKQTVNSSQAYVLFYMKDSSKANRLRKRFHQIEQATSGEPKTHMVSTHWMTKFLTMAEPGPIDNRELFETPVNEDETRIPCVRVTSAVWHFLSTTFKGGPNVLVDHYLANHAARNSGRTVCPSAPVYALPVAWLNQWESYVKGQTSDPPGPIDNSQLTPGQICSVTQGQWDLLVGVYGGGPPVLLKDVVPPSQQTSQPPSPSVDTGESKPLLENGDSGIWPQTDCSSLQMTDDDDIKAETLF